MPGLNPVQDLADFVDLLNAGLIANATGDDHHTCECMLSRSDNTASKFCMDFCSSSHNAADWTCDSATVTPELMLNYSSECSTRVLRIECNKFLYSVSGMVGVLQQLQAFHC